jgi:hypothetical protein
MLPFENLSIVLILGSFTSDTQSFRRGSLIELFL